MIPTMLKLQNMAYFEVKKMFYSIFVIFQLSQTAQIYK